MGVGLGFTRVVLVERTIIIQWKTMIVVLFHTFELFSVVSWEEKSKSEKDLLLCSGENPEFGWVRLALLRAKRSDRTERPDGRMGQREREARRHTPDTGAFQCIYRRHKNAQALCRQREISGERERRNIKRRKLALLRVACGINHMCSHSSESPEARSPPALLFVGATRR
jgi:hypothetical protein